MEWLILFVVIVLLAVLLPGLLAQYWLHLVLFAAVFVLLGLVGSACMAVLT